jgi:hypothetical protein
VVERLPAPTGSAASIEAQTRAGGPYKTNPRPGSVPMSKALLIFGGSLFGLAGLAALFSMAFGDAVDTPSPSPTPALPPPPANWSQRPTTRAAARQAQAERTPGTEQRWIDTDKLAATDPRVRLPELLDRLRKRGLQPRIAFSWRSLATQDYLLAQKRSSVSFSFHNAVADGAPASLAADLFDARYGWGDDTHGSPKSNGALTFFRALGEEARALGLVWGGAWKSRPSFWSRYGIGWDPAHVQAVPNTALADVRNLTLPQLLGEGRVFTGSGGYVYRQFGNGYLQVIDGPALRGQLLMPRGNARAWQAITREIGAVADARAALT